MPDVVKHQTSDGHLCCAAIAGGVVGGVVGALLLAGLAWFFVSKRRQGTWPMRGHRSFPLDEERSGRGKQATWDSANRALSPSAAAPQRKLQAVACVAVSVARVAGQCSDESAQNLLNARAWILRSSQPQAAKSQCVCWRLTL